MSPLPATKTSQIETVLPNLPQLPSSLRYWDDYLDSWHLIRDLAGTDVWIVNYDGGQTKLKFDYWPASYRTLVKIIIAEMFSRLDVTTVLNHDTIFPLRPDLDAPVIECLTRHKPMRLIPQQSRHDGLPSKEQAPCLAVPIFGWAEQAIGLILFGPHETGSDITPDEYDMLQALAVQAGHGYDRVEKETLRHEVRDLRARLAGRADAPPPPSSTER